MAVEFNLVYRWHPLVPPQYRVGDRDVSVHGTLYETQLLTENGLGQLLEEASSQPAGKVGVFITHRDLAGVQQWSVEKGRAVQLGSYNDYRELCGYPRVTAFNQISGDPEVQRKLEELYGTVDGIEFYSGLYAEDIRPNSVLPSLIGRMVGIDAFSQAFTNPLLSPRVFNEATFLPMGMEVITSTRSLWRHRAPQCPRHRPTVHRPDAEGLETRVGAYPSTAGGGRRRSAMLTAPRRIA